MTRVGSPRRPRRKASSAAAIGLAVGLLAACGAEETEGGEGTAVSAIEDYNAMSGTERHDALVEAAQEEGAVVFYSTAPGWEPVLDAFSDEYDIEVEVFNGRSETILQRVVQEHRAGLHAVDVFEDEASQLLAQEEGMTTTYVNEDLTSQIPGYDESLGYVPFRLSVPAFAWNTDQVSDEEVPETIADLADPRWDGKLTMDAGAWPWYTGVRDYLSEDEGWSEDQIDEFFATLVDYSSPQASSITMTELVAAGEYAAGTSMLSQVVDRNANVGAPVSWQTADGRYVEPLIAQPEGAVLMANAPHPAAAVLLIDFVLQEGARVLTEEETFVPTAVSQPGGPLENVDDQDLRLVDPSKITDERDRWADEYDALIRGEQ